MFPTSTSVQIDNISIGPDFIKVSMKVDDRNFYKIGTNTDDIMVI